MHQRADPHTTEDLWRGVLGWFRARGMLRRPVPARRRRGWAVRFVLTHKSEVAPLQLALTRAGYRPGKAVQRHGRHVVEVEGRDAVEALAELWHGAATLAGHNSLSARDAE